MRQNEMRGRRGSNHDLFSGRSVHQRVSPHLLSSPEPWARRAFLVPSTRRIQRRLTAYRGWHTDFRPRAAHGTLTPAEVEERTSLPEPVVYRQRGGLEPRIRLRRRCVRGGDPRLAYPVIRVVEHRLEAA